MLDWLEFGEHHDNYGQYGPVKQSPVNHLGTGAYHTSTTTLHQRMMQKTPTMAVQYLCVIDPRSASFDKPIMVYVVQEISRACRQLLTSQRYPRVE
jgi:hypothetical protein